MLASDKASLTTPGSENLVALFSRLAPQFAALDRFMTGQISKFEPEIREPVGYCLRSEGKRIRPALVFMAGWECADDARDDLVRLAAVIEMVHLATLVHDDIMDEASMRRNRSTAARKFGPHTSVLLGDALFAQAVLIATRFPTTMVCRQVSESTRRVCAGEIMQTLEQRHGRPSFESYRRVIDLKTAELFHLSCHLGATLAGFPDDFATAAGQFGRNLGVAYQVYDDLADFFGREDRIGKTLGTDFTQGKCTLPMLVLLDQADEQESADILDELSRGSSRDFEKRSAQMAKSGVFESVSTTIREEIEAAESVLQPFLDRPPARELLRFSSMLRFQLDSLRAD